MVNGLIWDEWNKEHIAKHGISPEEVEEVCHGTYEVIASYRKRLLLLEKKENYWQLYYRQKIEI